MRTEAGPAGGGRIGYANVSLPKRGRPDTLASIYRTVIKLYGITNCSTVKKARAWLDSQDVPYEFVDFKKTPPTREQVERWCTVLGKDAVVNTRGTTWRKLGPAVQAQAQTQAGAVAVLVEHPSAVKRPVIESDAGLLIGFDENVYAQRLRRR